MREEPNCLIVEDDPEYAGILSALLRLRGWHPAIADSMAKAIMAIQASPVEVVLLDLRLPDSNTESSLDRIPAIKEMGPSIVIIVTGAPVCDQLDEMARNAGADAVLSKDRDIPERLYDILDRHRMTERARVRRR